MKKKFLNIILIILLSVCLIGCDNNTSHTDSQNFQDKIENENNNIDEEQQITDIEDNNNIIDSEKNEIVEDNQKENNESISDEENDKTTDQENNTSTENKEEDKTPITNKDNNNEDKTPVTDKENNGVLIDDENDKTVTNDKENNSSTENKEDETITDKETVEDNSENLESDQESDSKVDSNDENSSDEQTLTSEQISAKKIVDKITTSSMSDFSKALAIHDWLTFNVDYDQTYSSYTVETTLSKRVAVCEGYARTFKMMAELAGLEAEIITGSANGESHAWNQVKINGTWYNVDVTWDDPTFAGKKASDHTSNRYNYFLISDSTIRKDHTPSTSPHTCSSDYNRVTVWKSGINNGYRSNHGFATNQSEANTVIKKMAEAGYNDFYIWYYNSSLTTTNMWDEFKNLTKTASYPVTSTSASVPQNNIVRYKVQLNVSIKEWNNIPVVHNNSEFIDICNGNATSESFMVRYESIDGNYDIKGVTYGYSYYVTEYGPSYHLYTIMPNL